MSGGEKEDKKLLGSWATGPASVEIWLKMEINGYSLL